jgi:hypothetical protein
MSNSSAAGRHWTVEGRVVLSDRTFATFRASPRRQNDDCDAIDLDGPGTGAQAALEGA